jgi:hypothetical protein
LTVEGKDMSVFRESLPERKLWGKVFPWLSALVLAAGVIALIIKLVPGTSGTTDTSKTQHPVVVPNKAPKTVPLSNAARHVAGRFILTAVRRKNLAEAWKLSGPQIRQDLSLKEWMTGSIPVVPYLAPTEITPMKIDYSFKNHALVEISMVPKKGTEASIELYWLELKRIGAGAKSHWVVWSWVPRWSPPIRANPNG